MGELFVAEIRMMVPSSVKVHNYGARQVHAQSVPEVAKPFARLVGSQLQLSLEES